MKNVFGLLAAAIAVIFLTCPASAGFRSFSAPHFSAPRYSAPRFSAPRSRSFSRGRTNYRSRSFSRSRTRSHSVTHSRSFTRHSSTRHQHASPHRPSHATHTVKQQHLTTHGDKHGGSQKRVQRFNPTASVGHYAPGTLLHNSYNGHNLTHKVVGAGTRSWSTTNSGSRRPTSTSVLRHCTRIAGTGIGSAWSLSARADILPAISTANSMCQQTCMATSSRQSMKPKPMRPKQRLTPQIPPGRVLIAAGTKPSMFWKQPLRKTTRKRLTQRRLAGMPKLSSISRMNWSMSLLLKTTTKSSCAPIARPCRKHEAFQRSMDGRVKPGHDSPPRVGLLDTSFVTPPLAAPQDEVSLMERGRRPSRTMAAVT